MNRSNPPPRRRTQSTGLPLRRIDPVEVSTHSSRRSWNFGSPASVPTSTNSNPDFVHASYSDPPTQTSFSTRPPHEQSNEPDYPTHITYSQYQENRAHSPQITHRDPTYQHTPDQAALTSHFAHRRSIPISFLVNPTPKSPQSSSASVVLPSPHDSTSNSPSYLHTARSYRHSEAHPDDSRAHGYPHPTQSYSHRLPRVQSSARLHSQPDSYIRHRSTERRSLPTPPYSHLHHRQLSSTSTHYRRRSQEFHQFQHQQTYPQSYDYRQGYPYPPSHPSVDRYDDRYAPPSCPTSMQHLQFCPPRPEEPVRHLYPEHNQGFELLAAASEIETDMERETPEPTTLMTKAEAPFREIGLLGKDVVVLKEEEREEDEDQSDHGDGDDDEGDEEGGEEEEAEGSNDQCKGKAKQLRQVSIRRTNNPDLKTTKTGKIQHKPKRVGINKRSTAYNRFLQKRSKQLAKDEAHLTPQQRMKRIAEEWAVSDKNLHKTRRKSRFIGPNGEVLLPLSTSSSPQPLVQSGSSRASRVNGNKSTEPTGPTEPSKPS